MTGILQVDYPPLEDCAVFNLIIPLLEYCTVCNLIIPIPRRLRYAEVHVPQGPFRFPLAAGLLEQPGSVFHDGLSPCCSKIVSRLLISIICYS